MNWEFCSSFSELEMCSGQICAEGMHKFHHFHIYIFAFSTGWRLSSSNELLLDGCAFKIQQQQQPFFSIAKPLKSFSSKMQMWSYNSLSVFNIMQIYVKRLSYILVLLSRLWKIFSSKKKEIPTKVWILIRPFESASLIKAKVAPGLMTEHKVSPKTRAELAIFIPRQNSLVVA